ncbi:hypothetical protein TNIN_415981 [Trichonephila inaurata madagascariensis]|uniref:RNase H type-1 domain-containing protein n=1 Tax=Trichonephila inaurata madagascariensis TaxID=2747483 RepID=A0A8X7BY33_9ARAC|nr:hypothetical protein TNIN_415981 [Trichonephila inaurata madagascariensis]
MRYSLVWVTIDLSIGLAILNKLKLHCSFREVHFQWSSSHIDIHGNKISDILAKEGTSKPLVVLTCLTWGNYFRGANSNDTIKTTPTRAPGEVQQGRRPGSALSRSAQQAW